MPARSRSFGRSFPFQREHTPVLPPQPNVSVPPSKRPATASASQHASHQRQASAAAAGTLGGRVEERLMHEADNRCAMRERAKRLQEDMEVGPREGHA